MVTVTQISAYYLNKYHAKLGANPSHRSSQFNEKLLHNSHRSYIYFSQKFIEIARCNHDNVPSVIDADDLISLINLKFGDATDRYPIDDSK